jgi:hypothetical protein
MRYRYVLYSRLGIPNSIPARLASVRVGFGCIVGKWEIEASWRTLATYLSIGSLISWRAPEKSHLRRKQCPREDQGLELNSAIALGLMQLTHRSLSRVIGSSRTRLPVAW